MKRFQNCSIERFYTDPDEIVAVRFTGKNFREIWEAFGKDGLEMGRAYGRWSLKMRTASGCQLFVRRGQWVTPDALPGTFYTIEPSEMYTMWKEL